MNFSENLQTLRKAKGISQEQLAEQLDVSRQAVSKWETDGGYPEIDKIVALCEIFGCTMDELITGKISVDKNDLRQKHERHYKSFSIQIATGVFLILLGVAANALLGGDDLLPESLLYFTTSLLFVLMGIAVFLFVIGRISHGAYSKNSGKLPELYSPEETEHFNIGVFPYLIGGGIALIFLGLICTLISAVFELENVGAALFLALIGAACWLFVYAGVQHEKYDIKWFNKRRNRETMIVEGPKDSDPPEVADEKRHQTLSKKICATIMLCCAAVFLLIGFVFNIWHPSWAVFPIGGIACAIVNVILGTTED